tara:strand:+ start:223 stop:744 length:522 start_codon:yes stop_codon:yes gene_type:complete
MTKYLIIYSTVDGQTKKISERIFSKLKKKGSVTILSLEEAYNEDIDKFGFIIIGASIRYGKHRDNLFKFIKENKITLESKMTAFFSVNVVARKPEKSEADTNPYIKKFILLSDWKPNYLTVFAGKIDYPKLRPLDKVMIRIIMWLTKGPTDTSTSHEFTDWEKVDKFTEKITP